MAALGLVVLIGGMGCERCPLTGGFKGLIGGVVLINVFGHSIPVIWGVVRGSSISHRGDDVLGFGI